MPSLGHTHAHDLALICGAGTASAQDACTFYKVNTSLLNISKEAGGDIYKLSKILGHSSVAVTEAHYAHLLKDDLVEASRQVKLPVAKRAGDNVVPMQPRRHA